jgi:hypothetical protein
MRRQVAFSSRVGDRWSFAIEFEGSSDQPRVWNERWGSLWLWVDGQVVGRPSDIERVMPGLESLRCSAKKAERGSNRLLASIPASAALNLVIWAHYGDEGSPPAPFAGDRSLLLPNEVLPGSTVSFFDGWEAILIEDGTEERFIYRQHGTQASEARWPRGTFKTVALQARDEFKRLATAGIGGIVGG